METRYLKKDLEKALELVESTRNFIIQLGEEEYNKAEPNEQLLYQLTDYKLELLDVKLRLKNMIENLHKIE